MNYIEISNDCLEEMKVQGTSPIMIGGEIKNATPVESDVAFWESGYTKLRVVGEVKELNLTLVARVDVQLQMAIADVAPLVGLRN